jgi:hypothetical protein
VSWAIFSDRYGVWFPTVKRHWYEKPPGSVTPEEFRDLVNDFRKKLRRFATIYFYYHPARFHQLYRRLLKANDLKKRIVLIRKVSRIV